MTSQVSASLLVRYLVFIAEGLEGMPTPELSPIISLRSYSTVLHIHRSAPWISRNIGFKLQSQDPNILNSPFGECDTRSERTRYSK
ncbi:hypothetical protein F4818DRAFT_434106 [Hypoxylon cercidicola]|nr:hypothetical protein F4818DRAFT_434106 [Hypoxylon cercidicola]